MTVYSAYNKDVNPSWWEMAKKTWIITRRREHNVLDLIRCAQKAIGFLLAGALVNAAWWAFAWAMHFVCIVWR